MHDGLQQQSFWEAAWVRHLETYLASPPRAAYWLLARFGLRGWSVLEIAGGSCRDSRYLASLGVDATGSDFDQRTLAYLAQRFPGSPLKLAREDAAALSLPDRSVDLSVHNGFWVLFDDDARVRALLVEQLRVTRRAALALVHNADNRRLVETFARKAKHDPLYDIRFFRRDELRALAATVAPHARRVTIEKFGGPTDRLLAIARPRWLVAALRRLVPLSYRWLPWRWVERVVLVIER